MGIETVGIETGCNPATDKSVFYDQLFIGSMHSTLDRSRLDPVFVLGLPLFAIARPSQGKYDAT
jgi:hypothetical protein